MIIELKNLENAYREGLCGKEIKTVDDFIEAAISFFREIKVDRIDCTASYSDMLLFQYGVWDFKDSRGEHFGFDITRQLIVPDEDEPYQLSCVLIFDPSDFAGIKPCDVWSEDFNSIEDFADHIKSTQGYKTAVGSDIKKIQLYFGKC